MGLVDQFVVLVLVLLFVSGVQNVEFEPELPTVLSFTILHTGDGYSMALPGSNGFGGVCTPEEYTAEPDECDGGMARRKTFVDQVRAEVGTDHVVVADVGGFMQGSQFYTRFGGESDREYLTSIGYNLTGLSSREFFDGPEVLARNFFQDGVPWDTTAFNLDVSKAPNLDENVDQIVLLEVDGIQIAFVCFVRTNLPTTTNLGPNITVSDRQRGILSAIEQLNNEGVKIIILMMGDAGGLAEFEDLIVSNPNIDMAILREFESEEYPLLLESPSGWPVPVVGVGAWGRNIGRANLEFDIFGRMNNMTGDLVRLDSSYPMDPDVQASVEARQQEIEEALGIVIAQITDTLNGNESICRHAECTMGSFATEVMYDWSVRLSEIPPDITFFNGGAIRASLDPPDVTNGQVYDVFPFPNQIVRVQVRGDAFKFIFENSVSFAAPGDLQDGTTGRFLQMRGASITWNPNLEPMERDEDNNIIFDGNRVTKWTLEDGSDFDDATYYHVALPDFIAAGGDGFVWFTDPEYVLDPILGGVTFSDAVIEYLIANTPITPFLRENIINNPNAQPFDPFAAERPSEGTTIAFQVLAGIGIGVSIFYSIIFVLYSDEKAVKNATPLFLHIMVLGSVMMYIAVFILSPDPTVAYCVTYIWLLSIGFTLAFGCLLIKNYRVARILGSSSRGFFRQRISIGQLFAALCVVLCIDFLLLGLFTGLDTPTVRHNSCKYDGAAETLLYVILAIKACMILPAIYISFQTNPIENQNFNESKHINWAVYWVAIIGIIIIPVVVLAAKEDDAKYIIICLGIIAGVFFSMAILMIPKCVAAIRHMEVADSFTANTSDGSKTGGTSTNS